MKSTKLLITTVLTLLCLAVFLLPIFFVQSVNALPPELLNRFDELSDATPGAVASHLIGYGMTDTTDNLGSIEFEFCSNSPLPTLPCTPPTGFDSSAANLVAQTNDVGFSIASPPNAYTIILTRTPGLPLFPGGVPNTDTYRINNITNPSNVSSLYVKIFTYSNSTATGTPTQEGGLALVINTSVSVTSEVPPFLRFCAGTVVSALDCSSVSNPTIDLGVLSDHQPTTATSQFVVATNAGSGYSVDLDALTLTSGNNVIPALGVQTVSKSSTGQFGINLRANTSPVVGSDPQGPGTGGVIQTNYNAVNLFDFGSGDTLVASAAPSDNQRFTVSYLINVSPAQPPGYYATTVTYICMANF